MSDYIQLEELAEFPLFRACSIEELHTVRAALSTQRVAAGAPLIALGQRSGALYLIAAGAVKVQVEHSDGAAVILAILGPGALLGELSFADRGERSASVIALTALRLFCLSQDDLTELVQRVPRLAINLAAVLAARLRRANEQILALATLDARGRVARQILALGELQAAQCGGETQSLSISQGELAEMTGMSRVRLNQIIQEFKRDGLVTIDSARRIRLHDRVGLKGLCSIEVASP